MNPFLIIGRSDSAVQDVVSERPGKVGNYLDSDRQVS